MEKYIWILTILISVISGSRSYDQKSCKIFELDKFVGPTELYIGNIAEICGDKSLIRIFKDTRLIFPTTEGFTSRTLPSKFKIEFIYIIKYQPICTWTLISITDCKLNELFSVTMNPEKKLVTVSFTDRFGKCAKSVFIDYDMSLTCRRELVIEVDDYKVSVHVDQQPLRYYSGDMIGNLYTRESTDLSNTETKLFIQEGDGYSVEMDIQKFVIVSYQSPLRREPEYIRTGAKGEPGRKGVRGDKGSKGDKGNCGPAGTDGADGETGERCDRSFPVEGVKGARGDTGIKGCKGSNGAAGSQGPDGATGTNGEDGANGSDGASGGSGPKGEKGSSGSIGNSGSGGNPGIKGAKGDPLTADQVKQIVNDIIFPDYSYYS